jgi:DNA-binding NarL/FixJ family response regulator
VTRDELITAGRAALRAGDAAGARRAFETGLGEWPDDGDLVEGLARAAYLELDFAGAMELWERAYAAHRASGDQVGAVRVARTLAYMYGSVMGDWAVMRGWIARAQTLLAGAPDSAEAGWVALDLGMFEEDRARKEQHFRGALEVARRVGDADLEFVTLAYLGASLVHADRTEEGMVLLDEALAAIAGREVDDFTALEEIFCQLFSACEHAHDVVRADQWIRVGEEIARRRNLPAVSAFCRTHYGGVLTTAGRWPEADEALMAAIRLWGLGHRMLRSGALVRLADLRVRQGRFEEAEQLLDGLEDDAAAARSLAAIELARGRPALARHVLERALEPIDTTSAAAAPLLALLVDADVAAGDLAEAAANVDRLGQCATRHGSDYLVATAALARARVCLATGDGDPYAGLSEALAAFSRARMPLETARSRLELAAALAGDRPEVAVAEARAALEAFERLQAARHVDAAAALLRSLGARTASARAGTERLTKRESEILDLLGHGLSNPEIADRLYISRKTVEHHVGSILAKLSLRSRAEAAAYATRAPIRAEIGELPDPG